MQTQSLHVYFYDLPANSVSTVQIKNKIKDKTGVDINPNNPPQIRREYLKSSWTAIVKFDNKEDCNKVCKEMRFFQWDPNSNREIRVLPFDKDIKGQGADSNKTDVFIRALPPHVNNSDLHKKLIEIIGEENEADLKSSKVAFDTDRIIKDGDKEIIKSRKYGFASFRTPELAKKVLDLAQTPEGILFHEYQPRDKKQMRKVYNNIIVKNFKHLPINADPKEKNPEAEAYIKSLFADYGKIVSVCVKESEPKKIVKEAAEGKKQIAFVCFDSPDNA